MTLKNGNIVAVERRMDLASLFCMIGRHGPAVAVAVLALVSVLVGFIIYRTVKGKRRKATAAAGDNDGGTPEEERDASVPLEESQSPVMSTDLSDEGSLDVKEDIDLIHNGHNVRRRCAAAAAAAPAWKEPSPFFPPMEDVQEIKIKHASSDDTVESAIIDEAYSAVETYREEACQCLTSDSYPEAEMVLGDAVDCCLSTTNVIFEGAVEEVHDMKSYLAEPGTIIDEDEKEENKTRREECQEATEVTSDWTNKQEEDTNHMSKDGDIETNTVGSSVEDPIICIEDAPVPCICSVKEEELEKENIESVLHSNINSSHLSMEEEQKAGCEEAEEECEDYKLIPEMAMIYSLTDEKEINLPSPKQDQISSDMDEGIPVIQDHVKIQGEEVTNKDHRNSEEEILIKEENSFTCHHEDTISHDVDNQVNEKKLEDADIVANVEEPETRSVETSPTRSCLSASPTAETKYDSLSCVTTDTKAHISGMSDFVDLSDCKETLVEYTIAPPVNETTESTILGSKMPLYYTDNEPEKVSALVFEVEYTDPVCAPDVQDCFKDKQIDQMVQREIIDKAIELNIDACDGENTTPPVTAGVPPPQGSPCSREQLLDEIIDSKSYDQAIATAVADTKIISSETAETEFLHKPSISQDQQRDQMGNENLDVAELTSSSDAALCNVICSSACIIADKEQQSDQIEQTKSTDETGAISASVTPVSSDSPLAADLMAEEISPPDVPSQSQQCDHEITETFDELEVAYSASCSHNSLTATSMAGELFVPNVLSSAQDKQSDLKTDSETFQEPKVTAAADAPSCSYGSLTALSMAEETSVPDVLYSLKDNKSDHKQDSETSDQAELAAASDTLAQSNLTEPLMPVEKAHPDMIPPSGDQLGDSVENSEHLDDIKATFVSETLAYDEASNLSTVISEELSNTEMMPSCQDILSNQARNNEAFPEVTVEFSPPVCPIYFPSLEQSELGDTDLFSGADRESGISSMAVSPDLQDAHIVFDMNAGNNVAPVQSYSLFNDDVAQAYSNENTGSMVFGPYPSHTPLLSHSERRKIDWINNETCAANEDPFGQEIENSYHREMDRFMAQIVDSVTSLADGLKKEADVKVVEVVEVLGIKEKKQGSAEKKDGAKGEEDEAAVLEKTEINIMEATMDNNEWITDSNYPVLPWMNLSAPSVTQDHTKSNQMLTEENSVKAEVSQMHTTDELPVTEVHQTSALSLNDENSENSKKIQAVQPMPQNVNVIFRVHYYTQSPYQTVAVTGDQQELGNWKEFIPLQRAKDGHWSTVVSLPAESPVEWKFVLLDKGEVCRWEECGNRLLETGSGDDLVVQKWWGIL